MTTLEVASDTVCDESSERKGGTLATEALYCGKDPAVRVVEIE